MSKLSRFFIGVILVGLAFIASLRLYRTYENYAQQAQSQSADPVLTFNEVPIDYRPRFEPPSAFEWVKAPAQEVFLGGFTLDPQAEKEQARQTISSILDDYRQDAKLQAFYADLKKATGQKIDLTDLTGENLGKLLKQYPQIQDILAQHSKDPAFSKTIQEIFANPQFVRSVAILQMDPTIK